MVKEEILIDRLLLEQGMINSSTLTQALRIQQKVYEPLAMILMKMKAISHVDLEKVLATQFGFVYLDPKTYRVENKELLKLIPVSFAKEHECFPLSLINNVLTVATVRPCDEEVSKQLSEITHKIIHLVVSRSIWINGLIEKYYFQNVQKKQNPDEYVEVIPKYSLPEKEPETAK